MLAASWVAAGQTSASAPPGNTRSESTTHAATASARITHYTLPPDLYRKAHNRGRTQFGLRVFEFFYTLLLLWWILRQRWAVRFRNWAEAVSRLRVVQALIFTPLLALTLASLQLPLLIFGEWQLKLYRISVQPWLSWFWDWTKVQLIVIVVGTLLTWGIYAGIRRQPKRWWLICWLLSIPFSLFAIFVSPYVIEPMFSEFAPLQAKAPQLITPLQAISRRGGEEVPPSRMFWMKASNKTVATNAYVSGFGASKRIVIWDTSLQQESTDGILTMFGHEMGHYALQHIWKGFLLSVVLTLVVVYLVFRVTNRLILRNGALWDLRRLGDWASLPALLMVAFVFGSVANVIGNAYSRHIEHQADVYGIEVTYGIVPDPGQAGAKSFQQFGETALIDPDPNPVNVFLFFTHPPVTDRVRFCATYDRQQHSPSFVKIGG